MLQSVAPLMSSLLERLPVFLFSGQFDLIVAVPLATDWVEFIEWSNQTQWAKTENIAFTAANGTEPTAYIKYDMNMRRHCHILRKTTCYYRILVFSFCLLCN